MAENKIIQERDLSSLKGSQRIRIRPSVNLGSDGIRGVQQTLFEVITNSIDRWKAGYGDKVIITRNTDKSFTIQDFADGLPTSWNEKEQAYNWDLALNTLYGGDNYTQSDTLDGKLGNFGLGLSSTMMSSEWMTVIVYRNGLKHTLKFKEGRPVDKVTNEFVKEDNEYHLTKEEGERVLLIEKSDNLELSGTIISYKPDETVFTSIDVPTEWIETKLRKQAMVNSGIELIFDDKLNNAKKAYQYNDISEYIKELTNDDSMIDIIEFKGEAEGQDVPTKPLYKMDYNIAFTFNNNVQLQEYYHNSSELTELNLNVTTKAVKQALANALHKYIESNKMYKKGEKIKFEDIEDSLICILLSRSTKTSYANQTKLSIDNPFIKQFINQDLEDKLSVYLMENPLDAKRLADQVLINKRANDTAQKTKLDLKNKLQGVKKGLKLKIEGLRDCDMKNSTLEERIFLVDEGLSANSTIADSFDNTIMGCLGLRGRFINSLKKPCSISDVLNNTPALGIIQAMGCGIQIPKEIPKSELKHFKDIETFNINNLRYGSIGLLCDSDAFGHGINLSILTFLYKYMPTLVKQGRVYIVISPRFEIIDKKGNVYYVYNEEEKQKLIEEIGNKNIDSIGIKKGLGEFNKDEFWDYVLSPKAREKSFIRVKYNENESEQIDYYFNMLMGDDIENRKTFIKERIVNVDLNELD